MKKVIAPILAAILIMGLAACSIVDNIVGEVLGGLNSSQSSSDMGGNMPGGNGYMPGGNTQGESSGMSGGIYLAAVTAEDLEPQLEAFCSVCLESFMAEFSYDDGTYTRLYDPEADAYSADTAPAALVPSSELDGHPYSELYEGYTVDPADASCLEVKNFASIADIKENLSKYLDESLYDEKVGEDFFEFDGKVYAIRGGRGYGAVTCGKIIGIISGEGDSLTVTAERLYFDEPDGAYIFTVRVTDGVLKIISAAEEEAVG